MKDWELFENECAAYLRERYRPQGVEVAEHGHSNSHAPDIVAGGVPVETKMARAQSGQFVVGYDDGGEDAEDRFFIAESCLESLSVAVNAVLSELNRDTEYYLDLVATQGWARIDVDERTVEQCIMEHYLRTKGEEFLVTGYLGDGKMCIPMTRLGEYFRTGAVLRYKPSGTRPIAAYDQENAAAALAEHAAELTAHGRYGKLVPGQLYKDGRHWHVAIDAALDRPDRYFGCESYYLSPSRPGIYRVKRRGRTNSITVVFTLDLHPHKFAVGTGFEELDAKVLGHA